jgi:polyhydroxyalkanoate synthesis regulator phasin
MAGFGDLVQKAFYLGVGVASYAGEKVGVTLKDVRGQAQKLVDELVARGEITAEEAQRLVNEMVNRAQQQEPGAPASSPASEPRRIEILDDGDSSDLSPEEQQAEELRRQVAALRQELEQLRRQP